MKICLISSLYPPDVIGGAEIYVDKIARQLSKENEVIVITTKPFGGFSSLKPEIEIRNKIRIYKFYPLAPYYRMEEYRKPIFLKLIYHTICTWNLQSYIIVREILKKEKPDIVHSHNLEGISISAFRAVASLNIKHVHTLHDYRLISLWGNLFRNGKILKPNALDLQYTMLNKLSSKNLNLIISPSKFTLDMHLKYGFFKDAKKIILPNGIEVPEKPIEKIKNEYIDIVYLGQIAKHKGVDILIRALKEVKNKKLRLHMVGKGPLLEECKVLAENDERIKFYGFVSEKEKKEISKLADILILPSIWYDNFPVSILESFCASTPVIGSKRGGIPELIKDEYNGFLIEPNIKNMKEILENLNEKICEQMGRNAFKFVKRYEMEMHIKKLVEVYGKLD